MDETTKILLIGLLDLICCELPIDERISKRLSMLREKLDVYSWDTNDEIKRLEEKVNERYN